uniref:Peptidase aspartic putative domain-containing protein n=1 Tax=Panagrolaimus sp. JU765 TaxID=591449 RepID=A0AC34R775_9BILA
MSEQIKRTFERICVQVKAKEMDLTALQAQIEASRVITRIDNLGLKDILKYAERVKQEIEELDQRWDTLIDNIADDAARTTEATTLHHWRTTRDDDNPGINQTLRMLNNMIVTVHEYIQDPNPPVIAPVVPIHDQLANMMIQHNDMIVRQNMDRMVQSVEKFDGQKTKWNRFWHLVDTRINPTGLDNVAKLEYVKQLLTGEAAKIGNLYESTEANYQLMLQKLKDRFGDEDEINQELCRELDRLEPVPNNNHKRLQDMLDKISYLMEQMEQIGIDTNQTLIQDIIIKKFPVRMQPRATGSNMVPIKEEYKKVSTNSVAIKTDGMSTVSALPIKTCTVLNPKNGKKRNVEIFLDGGSTKTFVQKKLADAMSLPVIATHSLRINRFNGCEAKWTSPDILIGNDYCWHMLEAKKDENGFTILESKLGKFICGEGRCTKNDSNGSNLAINTIVVNTDQDEDDPVVSKEDWKPNKLPEKQNVSRDRNVSRALMDNQGNQLVNDQSNALIVQEKDEIDISKTLIEGKMEEKVEEKILAFCQELPNNKMKIGQAEDAKKSAFQAENDEKSALFDGIKDGVAEPSIDDQGKWKMKEMKPETTKDGEKSKVLYETMASDGKIVFGEAIKCKMKQETVEETGTKADSNVLMDKKKNPAVTKAETLRKKLKKKREEEFGNFKRVWKKKHQNLKLKLKKYEQQMVIFNKKLKENQNDTIQAAETWKMEKESWTKMMDDLKAENEALKAENQALKLEENVQNNSLAIQKLDDSKLDESKRDYVARKPKMKQQTGLNGNVVQKLEEKKPNCWPWIVILVIFGCLFAMNYTEIGQE